MVTRKTWAEFRESGLLWVVNRTLHLFGWSIVYVIGEDGSVTEVYPARVKFRGFSESVETEGFQKVSVYLEENIEDIAADAQAGKNGKH